MKAYLFAPKTAFLAPFASDIDGDRSNAPFDLNTRIIDS